MYILELKIRPEKQIAEILDLSRSQVQKMLQREEIKLEHVSPQSISVRVSAHSQKRGDISRKQA